MPVNLAQRRRIYTEPGYKSLSVTDLEVFSDGDTTTSGISFSGQSLLLICDLGVRYDLDEAVYYRQEATTETVVFYGSQGEGFSWVTLAYAAVGQRLSVDLRESENKYRYIKTVHEVTEGTAVAFELEVTASADEIAFGSSGGTSKFAVDSGTNSLITEEIPVFNPDSVAHDFYCLLDPSDADSSGLLLGTSSGTLSGLYETGLSVPDDFPFVNGSFDGTVLLSGTVVLQSGTSSGYYYTPVIDISSLESARLFFQATVSGVDETGSVDNAPTVGVRLSNTVPTDGGWSSGHISTDSNWSVSSGTLTFNPLGNGTILDPWHPNYFQARVEFNDYGVQSPVLEGVGVEEGHKLIISGGASQPVFIKSTYGGHSSGREAALLVWYVESRNEIT